MCGRVVLRRLMPTTTHAVPLTGENLSKDDILKQGLLSVWVVTNSCTADLIGKSCVLIKSKQLLLGPVLKFHVPGTDRYYVLHPNNLRKIDHDPSFPYDGDYSQKFQWLKKNPLNGVAYGTGFRYIDSIEDQFELQLVSPSADESVGAAEDTLRKKRTLDQKDASAARPLKKKTRDDVFSKGNEVIVEATSGLDARYNGKLGTVLSQLRVPESMVRVAGAFYSPGVLCANSAKRYYHVSLPEHDITICGEYLRRAPVAGGAPGAP